MGKKKKPANQDCFFNGYKAFEPLTENQGYAKLRFDEGYNLALFGYAGTGKTYMACHFATQLMIEGRTEGIHIFRSAVPTRELGFLPGTEEQKMEVYEKPYIGLFDEILRRENAYAVMKHKGLLTFESTSYLRGLTIRNSTIIVDECQNLTVAEVNTLMTRVGEGCKIIFCGDTRQRDLPIHQSGISLLKRVLTRMPKHFTIVEMDEDDIVRSPLVRDWIITLELVRNEHEDEGIE